MTDAIFFRYSEKKKDTDLGVLGLSDLLTVYRGIVLAKLETSVGVSGVALSWFCLYLPRHSQSLSCVGHTASRRTVTRGVLQGCSWSLTF